jgi:hypothetical protein
VIAFTLTRSLTILLYLLTGAILSMSRILRFEAEVALLDHKIQQLQDILEDLFSGSRSRVGNKQIQKIISQKATVQEYTDAELMSQLRQRLSTMK